MAPKKQTRKVTAPARRKRPVAVTTQTRPVPVEEKPQDYPDEPAVFTTGTGPADQYHYHRQPTYHDQYAMENQGESSEMSPV